MPILTRLRLDGRSLRPRRQPRQLLLVELVYIIPLSANTSCSQALLLVNTIVSSLFYIIRHYITTNERFSSKKATQLDGSDCPQTCRLSYSLGDAAITSCFHFVSLNVMSD